MNYLPQEERARHNLVPGNKLSPKSAWHLYLYFTKRFDRESKVGSFDPGIRRVKKDPLVYLWEGQKGRIEGHLLLEKFQRYDLFSHYVQEVSERGFRY